MNLAPRETHELVASAVAIHHSRLETARSGSSDDFSEYNNTLLTGDELVVTLQGGPDGEKTFVANLSVDDDALRVIVSPYQGGITKPKTKAADQSDEVVIKQIDWVCELPIATLTIGNSASRTKSGKRGTKKAVFERKEVERIVQYEGRVPQGYKLRFEGSQQTALIRTRREHELAQLMLPPENVDVTKYLLSPMPGTLISCAVKPGQEVEAGQELAVVEAMKMQNVLRSEKKAIVKHIKCCPGAHLKVDQIIIEFESLKQ